MTFNDWIIVMEVIVIMFCFFIDMYLLGKQIEDTKIILSKEHDMIEKNISNIKDMIKENTSNIEDMIKENTFNIEDTIKENTSNIEDQQISIEKTVDKDIEKVKKSVQDILIILKSHNKIRDEILEGQMTRVGELRSENIRLQQERQSLIQERSKLRKYIAELKEKENSIMINNNDEVKNQLHIES